MKYIKLISSILIIFFFVQCKVIKPTSKRKIEKKLSDYKMMTEYILCKNYHNDFRGTIFIDFGNVKEIDNVLFDFMHRKNIVIICINSFENPNDNTKRTNKIEYRFNFIPLFGKRRELRFEIPSDYEIQSEKNGGISKFTLEKGIYYVVY